MEIVPIDQSQQVVHLVHYDRHYEVEDVIGESTDSLVKRELILTVI